MSIIDRCLDKNGILTVTLNRPDKLNALNKNILLDLGDICHEAVHQEQIKALLITGNGKAFCAGADISHLAECNAEIGYQFAVFGQTVFKQLSLLRKPVLMAVNGFAFGGGCEMAIAGHLRIAATTAKFGQPEVKLGVIPGYGGTQRLARVIGVVEHGFDLPLDDALHLEALPFSKVCASQDKQEGIDAFLKKRSPIFRGE